MAQNSIIAVDGYSSSGKSTFAKNIANELGYVYIDSGAMYRAVALYGLEKDLIRDGELDEKGLIRSLPDIHISFSHMDDGRGQRTMLNGRDVEDMIRGIAVSEVVSRVSQVHQVRKNMVKLQRNMASKGGVVMDGRDIGTVVFPEADLKIFMTADATVRAERRFRELIQKGMQVSLEEILDNILKRDREDENRSVSPLRKADDALVLDNSQMTMEEQMDWFRSQWRELHGHRHD